MSENTTPESVESTPNKAVAFLKKNARKILLAVGVAGVVAGAAYVLRESLPAIDETPATPELPPAPESKPAKN